MSESNSVVIRMSDYHRSKSGGFTKGVGLCAIFSREGDWAFDYALSLARQSQTRLNIFHFLESPYQLRRDMVFVDAERKELAPVTPALLAKRDKELRESLDERLDDYADVGFRLCEGNDEFELRRCFRKGDYEVLVIGYQGKGAPFGGTTTIDEFAATFRAPVVLVGPESADSYYINEPARRRLADLLLPDGKWTVLGREEDE